MGTLHKRANAEIVLLALRRKLAPPHFPEDEHKTRLARALYSVLVGTFITLAFSLFPSFFISQRFIVSLMFAGSGMGICLIVNHEMRQGRLHRASILFVSLYWVSSAAFVYISGGISAASCSLFVTTILLSALFLGRGLSLLTTAVTLAFLLALVVAESEGHPLPQLFVLDGLRSWMVFGYSSILLLVPVISLQNGMSRALKYAEQQLVEREKIEMSLRDSEYRFRKIFELSQIAIVISDMQGRVTSINPTALEQLGRPLEAVIGRNAYEIGLVDKNTNIGDLVKALRAGVGLIRDQEVRVLNINGSETVALTTISLIELQGVDHFFTVALDITERKRAEAALKESEERYRAISELISDYAFAFDVNIDGTLKPAWITDDSFTRLTGYVWAHLEGGYGLYHPDDKARAEADVAKAIAGHEGSAEYRIVTKDGRLRWVMIQRTPVWDDDHTRVIRYYAAAKDITDQKQAEKIRLELAVEIERRSTYRTLMSGVSHDIKTPLSIINTNLYALEKHPDPDVRQKNLNLIKQQTRRLQDFIEDLLAMSKLDAELDLRLSSVDLTELLEGVAKELTPIFEQKHQSFSRSVESGLPLIQADESLLRRAIINIIQNAANYTPEAGSIAARIRMQANSAVVEVSDTGIGIPSEELPYIFDPFYRGAEAQSVSRGGSGLGLAIVQHVIVHHGGRVEAESAPGGGSTFRILLPVGGVG